MYDINPLDILKSRKLDYIPPHFAKMSMTNFWFDDGEIEEWVKNHSEGRYAIENYPAVTDSGVRHVTFVAFEEEKELTYFMLAFPNTRR